MNASSAPNIAKLKRAKDLRALIGALDYAPDPRVRRDAAVALGEVGDEDCIAALDEAASAPDNQNALSDRKSRKVGYESVSIAARVAARDIRLRQYLEAVNKTFQKDAITPEERQFNEDYAASLGRPSSADN
jgi:HEAT repeat protein